MASTALVSVEEYLATSYRPDRDFVDGELEDRNLGELEHSLLQALVLVTFWNNREAWGVMPLPEQCVQVSPTRFRVPDVTVLRSDQPREPVITVPPLILIEILSKDDSLRSMRERVDEYLNFGVQHVWIIDPAMKRAYVCSRTAFQEPDHGELTVPGTPIRVTLSYLFSEIDRT